MHTFLTKKELLKVESYLHLSPDSLRTKELLADITELRAVLGNIRGSATCCPACWEVECDHDCRLANALKEE